jgi:NAD(P)-dependent dehydrogenase (short-subunit alcohol dehydrogenase family)
MSEFADGRWGSGGRMKNGISKTERHGHVFIGGQPQVSSAASKGMDAFSVYAASKAAIRSFARGWTTDLKARKIRVNAISPGVVPTEGYNTSLGMSAEQVVQFSQQMSASIPLGRVGTPDEVAKAMVFWHRMTQTISRESSLLSTAI